MTRAEQIMALYAQGHTTRVIAWIVYGLDDDAPYSEWDRRMAYVRVVVRQRCGYRSNADIRYGSSSKGQAAAIAAEARRREAFQVDPAYRLRRLGQMNDWYQRNRDHVREYRRVRYQQKRAEKALQDA